MRVNSIITTDYVFSSYIFLNLSVKLTVVFKRIFWHRLLCCNYCCLLCVSVFVQVCVTTWLLYVFVFYCVWQCCVCVCYGVIVCVRVMDVHQV